MKPVWIEIPAADIQRAATFYGMLFNTELKIVEDGPRQYANLPFGEDSPGGSVNQIDGFNPNNEGVLVYLDANGKVEEVTKLIQEAGGKIVEQKTSMGEAGFYVTFNDTEGNTLALWSMT